MVSRWESGDREPTVFDLISLARVLSVALAALVDRAERPGIGRRSASRAGSRSDRLALGRGLLVARRGVRMSLADAASATTIPTWRLMRIEAGCDPTIAELRALQRVIGFEIRALVGRARLDASSDRFAGD